MKELLSVINEFCKLPAVQVISIVIFICFGVYTIFRVLRVLKSDSHDLYKKENLQYIAFGLSSAIDGYLDNFTDEELLCNESYVSLCVLHSNVCKLLGEDPKGRRL